MLVFIKSADTCFVFQLQTGVDLEVVDSMPLLEWFANHYKDFGATLEIITDRSQEGAQFVRGFGGIGGTLIYINYTHFG